MLSDAASFLKFRHVLVDSSLISNGVTLEMGVESLEKDLSVR